MANNSHLPPEKQIYWRMRNAYEDRYHQAGGSVIGLALSSQTSAAEAAQSTNQMGFLASWERDGIAQKPMMDLDEPAGQVLMSTLSGISDHWEKYQKPIFDEPVRFEQTLQTAQRAIDGQITETDEFKSFLALSERAILGAQPDNLDSLEARDGHEALRQVSRQILKENPTILTDMQKTYHKEVDELLSALNETDLDTGNMDIFKMSYETGRHPAEIVGIGMAHGVLSPWTTAHLETFFSTSGRTMMAEAANNPEETLKSFAGDLSKEELSRSSKITLAAARSEMSKTNSLKKKAGLMGYALEGSGLNWDRKEPFALKLFGVQGSIVDSKERDAKKSKRDHDRS